MLEFSGSDRPFKIQAHHRPDAYNSIYRQKGRIHIPDFFDADDALALAHALANDMGWNTAFNTEKAVYDLSPEIRASLTEDQTKAIADTVTRAAADKYHFLFENRRLSEKGEAYAGPEQLYRSLTRFLNSGPFLAFARALTGHKAIAYADAQATRYRSGHFLHPHDDRDPGKGRIAAYVLNITPLWRAEWGGILNFMDEDGHIAEGYVPRFNAINIFDVGVMHYVSFVAPFAPSPRLSVTGWLRSR